MKNQHMKHQKLTVATSKYLRKISRANKEK